MPSLYEDLEVRPPLVIKEDEILGYIDPWIVSPGDSVGVKVRYRVMKWFLPVNNVNGAAHR